MPSSSPHQYSKSYDFWYRTIAATARLKGKHQIVPAREAKNPVRTFRAPSGGEYAVISATEPKPSAGTAAATKEPERSWSQVVKDFIDKESVPGFYQSIEKSQVNSEDLATAFVNKDLYLLNMKHEKPSTETTYVRGLHQRVEKSKTLFRIPASETLRMTRHLAGLSKKDVVRLDSVPPYTHDVVPAEALYIALKALGGDQGDGPFRISFIEPVQGSPQMIIEDNDRNYAVLCQIYLETQNTHTGRIVEFSKLAQRLWW